MRRLLPLLALVLAVSVHAQAPAGRFAPDRLVVRFSEPLALPSGEEAPRWADPALGELAARSGVVGARPLFPARPVRGDAARVERAAALRVRLGLDATYVLELGAPADIEGLVAEWAAHPAVVFAEPDYTGVAAGAPGGPEPVPAPFLDAPAAMAAIPNDPFFDRQYGFHNTGTNANIPTPLADADINLPEAWDLAQGSPGVVIAIIDSGLRLGHPDIASRVWTNAGETANGLDDDGNGLVDDVRGWDYVNNDNDPTDDAGHGSNIAGLVGAIANNELGYAGIDQAARLMILKGFDAGLAFFYSWAIPAVTYAVDEGANIVNFSAGGTGYSEAFEAAVNYAHGLDVLFTAPMMNFNDAVVYYPAAYANAVAVGATNARDERAAPFCWGGGSNYGPHIELTAPGDRIYNITYNSDTNYNVYWCGSSMSAPTVAATASLMLSVDPTLTPDEILAVLRVTAEDQVGRPTEDTPGFDVYHGYGRLDAFAALSAVTTAAEDGAADRRLSLAAAPNPATHAVRLALMLEGTADVSVAVFDVLGREVASLHEGPLTAGSHAFVLDAARLPAGVYVVRAATEGGVAVQRVTVAR